MPNCHFVSSDSKKLMKLSFAGAAFTIDSKIPSKIKFRQLDHTGSKMTI